MWRFLRGRKEQMDRREFAEKYGLPVLQAFERAYEASEGLIGGVVIEPDEEGRFVLEFLWDDAGELKS